MFEGQDIVFLSTIRWNFLWQRHQIMATALAGGCRRLFYVENMHSAPQLSFSLFRKVCERLWRVFFRAARAWSDR